MVIVVQFLTAHQNTPGGDIAGGIPRLIVAITPVVPHPVDHSSSPKRNPQHLHRPDRQTRYPKQQQVDGQHQGDTQLAVGCIETAFQPIVGGAMTVTGHGIGAAGFIPVEFSAFPQHLVKP